MNIQINVYAIDYSTKKEVESYRIEEPAQRVGLTER